MPHGIRRRAVNIPGERFSEPRTLFRLGVAWLAALRNLTQDMDAVRCDYAHMTRRQMTGLEFPFWPGRGGRASGYR